MKKITILIIVSFVLICFLPSCEKNDKETAKKLTQTQSQSQAQTQNQTSTNALNSNSNNETQGFDMSIETIKSISTTKATVDKKQTTKALVTSNSIKKTSRKKPTQAKSQTSFTTQKQQNTSKFVQQSSEQKTIKTETKTKEDEKVDTIRLFVEETELTVKWEENESVDALKELVKKQPIKIQMSMYGGFEQVGDLGARLPQNDKQTTTTAGDIVLYSGNQIVIFYGSNSWAYTRLGKVSNMSASDIKKLLGNKNVLVTLSD